MSTFADCPKCGAALELQDEALGIGVTCPGCGKDIRIENPMQPRPRRIALPPEPKSAQPKNALDAITVSSLAALIFKILGAILIVTVILIGALIFFGALFRGCSTPIDPNLR